MSSFFKLIRKISKSKLGCLTLGPINQGYIKQCTYPLCEFTVKESKFCNFEYILEGIPNFIEKDIILDSDSIQAKRFVSQSNIKPVNMWIVILQIFYALF